MTRHSDLYSDNEDEFEEHESGDEEPSPTNGYFNDRAHPQDVFVMDPTTTVHAKELEAAHESSSPTVPSSSRNAASQAYTPSSPARSWPDESTPLLATPRTYEAPPPAYSYNSPTSPQRPHLDTAAPPLFPESEPQSMGNPPIHPDTERNMYIRPERSRMSRLCSHLCTVLVFVVIVTVLCILAGVSMGKKSGQDSGHSVGVLHCYAHARLTPFAGHTRARVPHHAQLAATVRSGIE